MLDVREKDGVVLVSARVRPRSRPGLSLTDGGLVISVAAPPEKSRATEEGRRALASALGVSSSSVQLRSGAAARRKVFVVSGMPVVDVRRRLLAAAGNT
ncbi:MAG: DUF167 domain-containing protein [Actinomycetota bacterium]